MGRTVAGPDHVGVLQVIRRAFAFTLGEIGNLWIALNKFNNVNITHYFKIKSMFSFRQKTFIIIYGIQLCIHSINIY